jgi:hypothetical protein
LVASAVGKLIAKVPLVEVLSPPKLNTHTAALETELLYIKAPAAVIVELAQEVLENEI